MNLHKPCRVKLLSILSVMLVCVQVVINEVGALPTACEVLHMPHQFQLVVAVQLTSLAGALQVTVKEWMPLSASHSKTCICTSLHGHLIRKFIHLLL
jgi:cysteine sulfinate desulfinase/cysteine desulfurase-like protein